MNTEYNIDFTIQDLIDLKVHFGHRVGALNPKMRDYVFGTKNGISIIDVRKTYINAQRALNLCYRYGKMGKKVLFVGTAPQIAPIVKECAEKCGQFYVTDRWLGGILTNWYTVSKSIKTLLSYNKLLEDKENGLSKKEILTVTKNRDKLMASFGGLMNLRGRTDISYPIVSNDDSASVAKFFCDEFSKALLAGVQEKMKDSGVDMSSLLNKKNTNKVEVFEVKDEQK